jgi:hypothetical protein
MSCFILCTIGSSPVTNVYPHSVKQCTKTLYVSDSRYESTQISESSKKVKLWYTFESIDAHNSHISVRYGHVCRHSVVGVATRYESPGIESRKGEIFRSRPERPWGPRSPLKNWYRVTPGGKTSGAWRWPPTSI